MVEVTIFLAGFFVVVVGSFIRAWWMDRKAIKRTARLMWDSRVQGWVSEGLRRGYVRSAGQHIAYDGRTKVQMLVVQTTAVKKLYTVSPPPEDFFLPDQAEFERTAVLEWRKEHER